MARTALYRLFNIEGRLLYVGITDGPETRWNTHASQKHWWPNVATKTVEWFDTRNDAEAAERRAIYAEAPLHNVMHVGGRSIGQHTAWWAYVMEVSGNASHTSIASKVGLSQPSVSQWRTSRPRPTTIRAFAAAYNRPVVEAFIGAGLLTEDEAREIC